MITFDNKQLRKSWVHQEKHFQETEMSQTWCYPTKQQNKFPTAKHNCEKAGVGVRGLIDLEWRALSPHRRLDGATWLMFCPT